MSDTFSDALKVLSKFGLWQFAILISIFLLILGFVGEIPFTGIEVKEGRSLQAITAGVIFFLLGINLKLTLMLVERDDHKGE